MRVRGWLAKTGANLHNMVMDFLNTIWHGWLKRPYRLHIAGDGGERRGTPIIFLHGLGRSSEVWEHIAEQAADKPWHIIAFDLLGFGDSPKPERLRYDVDDHAKAVIATITKMRLGEPVVLVGHSMGCLIAVRVARLRPDLVRHLVLYEMPLYAGLPDKRMYKLRLALYFSLYERVVAYKPIFSGPGKPRAQRLAEKIMGYSLDDATWKPFVRSLKHTVMTQTTHLDIKHIDAPMDIIYGTRDRLVIRGKTKDIFGDDVKNVTAHSIRANHGISAAASKFIVERIENALQKV